MKEFDANKFAQLARIKLTQEETKKIGGDLEKILGHFEELKELDTEEVSPMTGGTSLKNVFREDQPNEKREVKGGQEQFPDSTKDGYLRVHKVFDND
jgi:aspartyl-tRNA(Asn)/glutamyl-tRNA(Gln) amidotransferase subunit C